MKRISRRDVLLAGTAFAASVPVTWSRATAAPAFANTVSSFSSSGTGALGVGWSCGAYSNPETFSKAAAEQFVNACNRNGMSVSFLYPGNAKNEMIEDKDDGSLETAQLVAMYGHGNTAGPDLEYKPVSTIASYWDYKWGDKGTARWIFIGGCDALGFPVYNDNGAPAENVYPYLDRYRDTFVGISGICGYRSSSWYIPGFQALSPINEFGTVDLLAVGGGYGAELANRLNALATFYESWTGAAHWLHARLGRQAETAVFANTVENLAEHLNSYRGDRRASFDPTSVRRTMVGSGSAPEYHYCHVVDHSNPPKCVSSAPFAEYLALSAKVAEFPAIPSVKLPVFSVHFSSADAADLNRIGSQFGIANLLEIQLTSGTTEIQGGDMFVSSKGNGEILISSRRSAPIDNQKLLARVVESTARSAIKMQQNTATAGTYAAGATHVQRSLDINNVTYPLRLDGALIANGTARGVRFEGAIWSLGKQVGERLVPSIADALGHLTGLFESRGTNVKVKFELVYVRVGTAFSGKVIPSLQANLVETYTSGRVDTMCLFL